MRLSSKSILEWVGIILLFSINGCGKSSVNVHIRNETGLERKDETITIPINKLPKGAESGIFSVLAGEKELPNQTIDSNIDGKPDDLVFVVDLAANESKNLTIAKSSGQRAAFPHRTQAELSQKFGGEWKDHMYTGGDFRNVNFVRVPDEHTDHSTFFRYEGPGWESDKVGYRFYLDWRNAADIFGKKTHRMVLQDVGLDGFDSYHVMADWGMDILQVGESLGMGSIGMWQEEKVYRVSKTDSVTCKIVANGPVYSQIRTRYFGWQVGDEKYDLSSNLSITAGSRMTKHELNVDGNVANLCTGLVKHQQAALLLSEANSGGWRYLANYGKQTLADDNLGMAVLFHESNLIRITEDAMSHIVVLKPQNEKLSYYFLAAWEKEPDGITNKEEFIDYLKSEIVKLNNPTVVTVN